MAEVAHRMKPPRGKPALAGTVVLITGGTGSFGSATIARLRLAGVREIRIFSRDEKKQQDMRLAYKGEPLTFYIGDVRDPRSVAQAMHGVDHVFHAAALKQVPTAELFPLQAVQTNILGSANVLEAAMQNEVKSVVCLSTDKAVMPVNAMGMTKGLLEKLALATARLRPDAKTKISIVRYGNVMMSRGSVIPLFLEQIAAGRPVTITRGDMTRFMLPLADAVELVLFAMQQGGSGRLFIRKSPVCTIEQLARCLMQVVGKQVPTQIVGTRMGEKVHETLASAAEMARGRDDGDYLAIEPEAEAKDGAAAPPPAAEAYTSASAPALTDDALIELLRTVMAPIPLAEGSSRCSA